MTAAVVRRAGGPFIMESVVLDEPRPDEVLVEIAAAGICHTDLSARDQAIPFPLPGLLGHEGAGVVRAVGSAVDTVRVGDRVLMSQSFCGSCPRCEQGRVTNCPHGGTLGLGGMRADGSPTITDEDGAAVAAGFLGQSSLATHALARAVNVVPIAEDLPWELAAPLGCGVQTGAGAVLNVLQPAMKDTVVVFGAGTVGLSAVMAAAYLGVERIVVVDVRADRLTLARDLGACETVDGNDADVVQAIKALTSGGVDYSVEASGAVSAGPASVACLASDGTCALLGVPAFGTPLTLDWLGLISGQTVTGAVFGGAHPAVTVGQLTRMWRAGKLPLERLVRTYAFDRIQEAADAMQDGRVIKPVLLHSLDGR